jgi:PAS domain S-box-containing protein
MAPDGTATRSHLWCASPAETPRTTQPAPLRAMFGEALVADRPVRREAAEHIPVEAAEERAWHLSEGGFRPFLLVPALVADGVLFGALNVCGAAGTRHGFSDAAVEAAALVASAAGTAVLRVEAAMAAQAAADRLKRVEDVEARHALQRGLLAAVGQAVVASTLDQTIIYWNGAATALFGYAADEVLGRRVDRMGLDASTDEVRDGITQALSELNSWSGETVVPQREGPRIPAHLTVSPLLSGGQLVGTISVLTDLRPYRDLDRRLRAAEPLHLLARLAGTVADELHTELSGLTSRLGALEVPSRVLSGMSRARGLAAQLGDLGEAPSGEPEVVALDRLLQSLAPLVGRIIGVDRTANLERAARLPPVLVDRRALAHFILHCTALARRGLPKGGEFSLSASARLNADTVRLELHDGGEGLDLGQAAQLVQPRRASLAMMGLSTTVAHLERGGAHLELDSRPAGGTTFVLHLPRADTASAQLRALVVSASKERRERVGRALSAAGLRVETADDLATAMQICERVAEPFRLLAADTALSGAGGLALGAWFLGRFAAGRTLLLHGGPPDSPPPLASGLARRAEWCPADATAEALVDRAWRLLERDD